MRYQTSLSGYFLTRVFPVGVEPFRSVMDLPRDEAERFTAQYTKLVSSRGSYYDHRLEVETWLRSEAEKAGISIRNRNPLYFALTPDQQNAPDDATGIVSLPASGLDLSACSFTLSDSFCNHEFVSTQCGDAFGAAHPWLGRVFNAQQLGTLLKEQDVPPLLQGDHAYIEVQMWARP